jgi:serine/threonine protein kinase/CHASE1-domain containing sensor protein
VGRAAPAPAEPRPWGPIALVLIVGISLSVVAFVLLRDRQAAVDRAVLAERVTSLAARLGETLAIPIETARSAGALFEASELVTREEFARFVAAPIASQPQVFAYEWAPRVPVADRGGFEAAARAGVPDYAIRQVDPSGRLVVAADRSSYVPLLYLEPITRAVGYDVASNPELEGLLGRACATAAPTLSGRRRLVGETGGVIAAIAFVPTWRHGVVPADPDGRCRSVLGYVILIFHLERTLERALGAADGRELAVVLRDLDGGAGVDVLVASGGAGPAEVAASDWRTRRTFAVVDRRWAIDVAPVATPIAWTPVLVLALGVVASLLAAALAGGVRRIIDLRREVTAARSLGQYVLEDEIGRGGMGVVYRARHALLQRPTAIKLVAPDAAQPNLLAQFEREVQITSQLSHPNTIAIYDYGHTRAGEFYYVMELVDGVTFEQLIGCDGAQPVARVVHLLRQIAGALREAHLAGIVHRDLKPANLMLTSRGAMRDFVKVLDFGLVKQMEPGDLPLDVLELGAVASSALTAASRLASTVRTVVDRPAPVHALREDTLEGRFLGTAGYASPEAVVGGTTDARSDLYAVGAIGYALVTGRPAFDDNRTTAIFAAQLRDHAPRPSTVVPGVPAALDDLLCRCLARDPGRRPQSADELLTALDHPSLPEWTALDAEAWWHDRAAEVRIAAAGHVPGRPTAVGHKGGTPATRAERPRV